MCGSHDSSLYVRYLCCWGIAGTVIVNVNLCVSSTPISNSKRAKFDNGTRIRVKTIRQTMSLTGAACRYICYLPI
jgi:hypothetical protein